jgi:hypothetical protein
MSETPPETPPRKRAGRPLGAGANVPGIAPKPLDAVMLAALAAAGYNDWEIAQEFKMNLSQFSRRVGLNQDMRRAVLIGRGVLADRLSTVVYREALAGDAKSAISILRMQGAFRRDKSHILNHE